jgi:hypothetical protein
MKQIDDDWGENLTEEEFNDWLDLYDSEWKRNIRVKERNEKIEKIKSKI